MTENDCRQETSEHMTRVAHVLDLITQHLDQRANTHDDSKLESPELEHFTRVTGQLRGLTYGSEEYKAALRDLKPALDHHYENNSHHPEHFENGVSGMTLIDLVEMFADWWAATRRHADGDIRKSIEHNRKRFELDPQLRRILENTVEALEEEVNDRI
jgi:hypothetical protein